MEQSLIAGLASIGLNEKQARIYLALLHMGTASAYTLSEHSGIKKPTTYVILDELIEKGIAHRIPRKGKRQYRPVSPETVIAHAERRMQDAREILPSLKSITSSKQGKIKVMHFDGVKAYKEALYYRINECIGKEIVGFYAEAKDMSPKILEICEEYNAFTKNNNITVKAFAPDHPSLTNFRKTDKAFGRIMRILPYARYSSSVSIDTFADVVRIVLNKNNQVVIIENADFAKTVREIFEMVWEK